MVIGIKRDSRKIAALERTANLKALLGAVVAGLAKALEVQGVKEEFFVSLVRGDVVNNRSGGFSLKM